MKYSLPYIFGYMIGACVPSFLISWLILLIAKPKTRATFSAIVLITCSVLMVLSLLGSKEKEFSLLTGIIAIAIAYALLWAIYKKDFPEEGEKVTTLNLSVTPQASFPANNYFNPSETAANPISGRYFNQNNPADYIELLPDGRFFMQERSTQLAGNFRVEDGILLLTVSTGQSSKAILQSNGFTDSDGKTWAQQFNNFSYPANMYYPPPPVQKRSSARPIIIAIGIIIITIITGVLIRFAVTNALSPKTYSEATAKWKSYPLQTSGLTLELPGEPKSSEVSLPPQAKDLVREHFSYDYTREELSCVVLYILYKDGIVLSAAGGAGGAAENLRTATGLSDLQYKLNPYDASRVGINGSCKLKGEPCGLEGIFITKGQKMWGIFTIYAEKNRDAVQAAKRVMSSVKID
jgi:hypothetical protein